VVSEPMHAILLVASAVGTAALHTLIPDHWLPFVLVGRSRGWSATHTAAVATLSAVVHVALSVAIGVAALLIGHAAAAAVGQRLERVAALLLLVFGLAYAGWAWHKGGHFHPGGAWLHDRLADEGCAGAEGDANPEHLHYHADEALIRERPRWGDYGLALLVGLNPCVLMLPILVAAGRDGLGDMLLVTVAYGLTAGTLTVSLSAFGVAGARRIRLPWPARHMEAFSGLLIAALGLAFWLL